jgi:two-component system chemotaxis response regulator CheY
MKTLIVEDDFVSRRLMQVILSPYGICHLAVNGREAVDAFVMACEENDPYDLICLDIMMPEMDGHEVLREVRRLEDQRGVCGLEGVKVIMITALSDPRTIMTAFKEQCEDYLIKPIEKFKLLDKVRKLGLIK